MFWGQVPTSASIVKYICHRIGVRHLYVAALAGSYIDPCKAPNSACSFNFQAVGSRTTHAIDARDMAYFFLRGQWRGWRTRSHIPLHSGMPRPPDVGLIMNGGACTGQTKWPPISTRAPSLCVIFPLRPPRVLTMDTDYPQPAHDGSLSSLTASIDALNLAEQKSSTKPAKTVFGSAGALLTKIRVRHPALQCPPPSSCLFRARWSMNKTTSSLGFFALAYVVLSTRDWMGKERMSSAGLSSGRSRI